MISEAANEQSVTMVRMTRSELLRQCELAHMSAVSATARNSRSSYLLSEFGSRSR